MAAKTYVAFNSAMVTTACPVKQTTGTAIHTMMQLAPTVPIRPVVWGCSFDGSAAATPGVIELLDTGTVFATMSTFYAAADIQPYGDPNAPANTAGGTGLPLALGTTALSGFTTAAGTAEGTITATRMADVQLIAPTSQYLLQFPLGREFEVPAGHCLRIRATCPVTVNMICWVIFEV